MGKWAFGYESTGPGSVKWVLDPCFFFFFGAEAFWQPLNCRANKVCLDGRDVEINMHLLQFHGQ